MADPKGLIGIKDLKTGRFKNAGPKGIKRRIFAFHYDDRLDTAMILLVEPQQDTVIFYLDDYLGFVYEEESLEIVGLRIEDFEESFLPANKSVKRVWLSIRHKYFQDFGELVVTFERTQPEIVREVVKATVAKLGAPGKQIEALLQA